MAPERSRVLVVDDEEDIAELMRRILMRRFEVVKCTSAAEARRAIDDDPAFDAVICDLIMPGESGGDLRGWLEQHHPTLVQRLGFVTGGACLPHSSELLAKLPHLRLEKPFEEEELLSWCGSS
jgi:two-component system, NtrC family, sensor kinase